MFLAKQQQQQQLAQQQLQEQMLMMNQNLDNDNKELIKDENDIDQVNNDK